MEHKCRECNSKNLEKKEGVFFLTGNIGNLDKEELWKCKDCKCPNYLIVEKHIDVLENFHKKKY